ncbi:helix-turn-helix transcriptional regulator [Halogeometricum limi]|uniref:Predicted transcriptional regulator, contains HTH domain n=1 Tax=Halogeometricum limi TaxID=555875 RepID=A0A1I6HZU0_9EURY|nr:transcriptional regulator [Halogeometricum limi]SFR59914.1 Predicted transcriptional regulator, contains HTH domain [Halogeometricum limi]
MGNATQTIGFIARSEHRVAALEALSDSEYDRRDLREATGASDPTIGRILRDFERRSWVRRDGPCYELTLLGAFVSERFLELRAGMRTCETLREVWQWLPREMDGFAVESFEDLVVSYPGPSYPYTPVERVSHLLESTESIRGLGTTIYKSGNLDVFCRRVLEGMEMEYVYSPEILRAIVDWNPELTASAFERDNCTIFLHDDLPDENRCGLNIMDDCIGLCGHDPDTAQLEAVIDTASPEAREWAEGVYERYRREARPFEERELSTVDTRSGDARLRVESE